MATAPNVGTKSYERTSNQRARFCSVNVCPKSTMDPIEFCSVLTRLPSPKLLRPASSVNGEVFCSTDAGDSWSKFAREFGEVHALIWVPN